MPLGLYPYQVRWILDKSRLKLAVKSRRIGYSFAHGLDCVIGALERKQNFLILSRSDRLSKEFIEDSVLPHVQAAGVVAQHINAELPSTSIYTHEVAFGNGSRIIAFSSSPDTARSFEGHVLLDEFAFHRDARKIYEAIGPSITRGYSLSILSTPNGQQGLYYDLAKEAGLVDGHQASTRWSPHRTDITEAIAQGCHDRNGRVLVASEVRETCLDDEMWQQEYCCQFLSTISQWISPELFDANVSDEASSGYPQGEYHDLYAGWDVARNKDLSVIWLIERVGDISWTRGVIEWRNVPTPQQTNDARAILRMCSRMAIDTGSMGLAIYETLKEEFYGKIEGVQFTLPVKEAMAVAAKRRMEEKKVRIPDTDIIRNSFRSVKKTVTATGQARFDAEHDKNYGHADHWWAFALAESAAMDNSARLGYVEYLKKKMEEQKQPLAKPAHSAATPTCPKCGSLAVSKIQGRIKCNNCQYQEKPERGKVVGGRVNLFR
jgi:phage FluMu gp28-like protein